MLILKDSSMDEILEFFDKAEAAGASIPAVIGPQVDLAGDAATSAESNVTQTVAYEARQLKNLFLRLYDN